MTDALVLNSTKIETIVHTLNKLIKRTFKEYALLNEERATIMKRIKERGTIYGG